MDSNTQPKFPGDTRFLGSVPYRHLPIIETFLSIEGEGQRTGVPVVFVRFAGCNLRCKYCDTRYSYEIEMDPAKGPMGNQPNYHLISWVTLTKKILGYNCHQVTFTGGEPLFQNDYIQWFVETFPDITVNIETNGSLPVDQFTVYPNTIVTMDYKCCYSGMDKYMLLENLMELRTQDVIKFVVGTDEDLQQVLEVLHSGNIEAQLYLSPVFGVMDLEKLAKFIIDNRHFRLRMGLQIHKIIWDPNKRGV